MKFFALSAVILLLLAQPANSAPSCQYKADVTNFSEVQKLYEKGTDRYIADSLEIRNITNADRWGSFEVRNPHDVPITAWLTFDFGYSVFAGPRQRQTMDMIVTIPPAESREIKIGPNQTIWARFSFYDETIRYVFMENDETYPKNETVSTTYQECEICLNRPCLDDGAACYNDAECGGGYCVENRCNVGPTCYELDCGCGSGEIQCPGNDRCMPKNALDLGDEPICSKFECRTNYTDGSGACAKSPEMLQAEENARIEEADAANRIYLLIVAAALAVGIYFILGNEFERRRFESDLEKKQQGKGGQ